MKICALGNSHLASLKLGLDGLKERYPNVAVTFFASRGSRLGGLTLEDGRLVTSDEALAREIAFTSNGLSEIVLQDYDGFLIYGLGLPLPRLDRRLSSAVQSATCRDLFQESLSFKLAHTIRSACAAAIYIDHAPQKADLLKSNHADHGLDYLQVFDRMRQVIDLADVHFLAQPEHTLSGAWNTAKEYSVGSTRLDLGDRGSRRPHPEIDMAHMNARFGEVYLEDFFRRYAIA